MFSFERIIAPVTAPDFFSGHWEKSPLVIARSDPGYYEELLSFADVDRFLATSMLRYPMLRMVRQGSALAIHEYTHGIQFGRGLNCADVITIDKAIDAYRGGATLIFQGLHRISVPLSILCRGLEESLTHGVQTNIYLTPKGSQGFAPHYDTHDVFVLQLTGHKHWKIYGSPVYLPGRDEPHDKNQPPPEEILYEFDLRAGDMVYIPRGFIHEAATSQTESLHITLGITSYTWASLMNEALADIKNDVRFRESLPVGFASDWFDTSPISARLKQQLREYVEGLDTTEAVEKLADKFVQTRAPLLAGHLLDVGQADDVTEADTFRIREHMLHRTKRDGTQVTLLFHGKEVRFPAFVSATLRLIESGAPFSAASLPADVDRAGRLVLVRRLLREGFITRVQ